MPSEDCLWLHEHDGLPPRRQESGGEKKAKPISEFQAWPAGPTSEHIELMAEGGVFDHELAPRAAVNVGHNLERFNVGRKRSELRPEAGGRPRGLVGRWRRLSWRGSTTIRVAGP